MNPEKLNLIQTQEVIENIESPKETFAEKRASAYAVSVETFKKHDGVELEAEQLLFRERLATSGPEVAIAGLQLKIDAAIGQKKAFEEKNDPFSAEAWAGRVEFLEKMKEMFCIYCDWKEKSPEAAQYLSDEHPWLQTKLEEAENLLKEEKTNSGENKPLAPDEYYSQEAGLQEAA